MLLDFKDDKYKRKILCFYHNAFVLDLFYTLAGNNQDTLFIFLTNISDAHDTFYRHKASELKNVIRADPKELADVVLKLKSVGLLITSAAQSDRLCKDGLKVVALCNQSKIPVFEIQHGMFQHVIPALVRLQEHSDIPVVAVGPVADALAEAKVRVRSYPLMEYREFAGFLRRFADAVALLPLDGSAFSGCKSPVKYLSYAEARIPVIADAVPPYSDIIVHDRNGWLADGTPEGWERAIRTLLDDRSRRERYVSAYDELALPTLDDAARLWSGLLKAVAVRPPDTAECPIAKLPPAWNWSQLRYFIDPRKYRSFLKLVNRHGINSVFSLLRKGM